MFIIDLDKHFTMIFFMFSSLQKYVREQILLAVAVIVKRGSLDKSIDCKGIFHEVSQLISSGNPTVVSHAQCIYTFILFYTSTIAILVNVFVKEKVDKLINQAIFLQVFSHTYTQNRWDIVFSLDSLF